MRKVREVRKRDNRIVPFDETKIADAIYAAFRSVGAGDRSLANELASAVTHFLEEKSEDSIPGIEDIQDVVETVLIEMGHTRVAKAYILYRQKRAMMRETLQVRREGGTVGGLFPEESPEVTGGDTPRARSRRAASAAETEEAGIPSLPEVDQSSEGCSSWQKEKIVAALIREADLDPVVADEVASNVERKVLGSGIRRISTGLIRELVDNELFERGYSTKLHKQASISLPKYNLEQIIFGSDVKEGFAFPKTPIEIRNIIANRILHQYSLQEVFTPGVTNAHNDGRIFIHRLSDPIRLSRLRWTLPPPATAVGSSEEAAALARCPAAYVDVGDFFRKLWHLMHFFSEEIRLSGLSSLLCDPSIQERSTRERIRSILERLSQLETRPEIALELDLEPSVLPWIEGIAEFARWRPRRFVIALRVHSSVFRTESGGAVLRRVGDLYEAGERVEFLPARPPLTEGASNRAPSPGRRLEAEVGKITLNLPRAAYRSGADPRSSIEAEIEAAADLAVKGHLERRRFIERLGTNRENPLWELTGSGVEEPLIGGGDRIFRVGIVGLNESVKYLTGHELHQSPSSARFGRGLVDALRRKLARDERSLGIRLALEETANVGPVRVLERADRRRCSQMREIDRGRSPQWGPSYTDGVRIHRMAPVDPLRRIEELSRYMSVLDLAGGFVEDFPELRSAAHDLLISLLEECLPVVDGGTFVGVGLGEDRREEKR